MEQARPELLDGLALYHGGMIDSADQDWLADNLVKLLGWGSGAFIILVGWLLSAPVRFDLRGDDKEFWRAILLCTLTPLAFSAWAAFTLYVRTKKLGRSKSPRLLPVWLIWVYVTAVTFAATGLVFFASLD